MPPRSKKPAFNYEEKIAQVEATIAQIESGSLSLEDVFEQFAQAVDAIGHCESFLNQGKQRMELSIEVLESPPPENLDF